MLAAGTISLFSAGGVWMLMPLVRPSTYSGQEIYRSFAIRCLFTEVCHLCDDGVVEKTDSCAPASQGAKSSSAAVKSSATACRSTSPRCGLAGYGRDWAKESGAVFAPGAENALLTRCGDSSFLKNEVEKLAALAKLRHYHAADGGRDWHRDAGRRYLLTWSSC